MQSENSGVRLPASGVRVDGSADPRTALALGAMRGPRERFDSAVSEAADRLRSLIEAQRAGRTGRVAGVSAELGPFASGRIDFDRFAVVFQPGPTIPPAELARIVAAQDVLAGLIRDGVAPHVVRVRADEDVRLEVGYTLARIGRVFGAARAAVKARDGMGTLRDEALIAAFAFRNWNQAEKAIAPPLVVELPGSALRADGLGDFLDGQLKLVLVVTGEAPLAALAEVITPSVFVAQVRLPASGVRPPGPDAGAPEELDVTESATAADVLARLAAFDGPGVVALFDEPCAEFVHDPSRPHAQRLTRAGGAAAPEHAIGQITAFRQAEGVRLLDLLAAGYAARTIDSIVTSEGAGQGAVGAVEPSSSSASDRSSAAGLLAAWLLKQADVPAATEASATPAASTPVI